MNSRSAALALGFSSVGHFFAHLLMLLYPTVLLVLEGRWGMSYGDLLSLSLGGFVLFGLGALPAGWLGDRWSAEGMMVIFFIGTGGAAIATGLTDGPRGAGARARRDRAVRLDLPPGRHRLAGPQCQESRSGARRQRDCRQHRPRRSGVRRRRVGAGDRLAGGLHHTGGAVRRDRAALLCCMRGGGVVAARGRPPARAGSLANDVIRTFIVLSFTMLADGTISQAITVALPKAFAAGLTGLTDGGTLDAGGFVTLVFLVAATAQLAGGWLADRFAMKAVYVLAWAAQVPLFVIAAQARNVPLLGAMIAVNYLGVLSVPAENALLARYTPAQWRATAFGAKFLLALGVSTIGVKLVAVIYDGAGSFAPLWLILAGCAGFVAVAGLFLPGRLRRAPDPRAVAGRVRRAP